MPTPVDYPASNPALDTFARHHGAVIKGPASFARAQIKAHATQYWAMDIDPDAICLTTLRFNSPPATAPFPAVVQKSLTLTEALLGHVQRPSALFGFLDVVQAWRPHGIALKRVENLLPNFTVRTYEGLYKRSTPQRYDASTHVSISPDQFRQFVKNTDLRTLYSHYIEQLLAGSAQYFPVLAKAAFIKAAFLQVREKTLSEADRQLALESVGLTGAQRWEALTPAKLAEPFRVASHIVVSPLKVHRYTATDILLIKNKRNQRTLLYIPGNSSPLQGFENESKLSYWLASQCREPARRLALAAHFQERDDSDGLFLSGLYTALEGVAAYPHWLNRATGSWPPHQYVHAGKEIVGDPFDALRDSLQARLRADARSVIHTRSDAHLEGLAEGLTRSLVFTGLIALMVPEAVPFIIGLSTTLIGVGAVQVHQGKTFEERKRAAQRIEFGVFNALPLAAESLVNVAASLSDATSTIEPLAVVDEPESVVGQGAEPGRGPRLRFEMAPPNLRSLSSGLRQSLKAFEASPASLLGEPTVHGPNGMLDIHHADGHYFVAIHDKAYEVCWEEYARQWRITAPDGTGRVGPFIKQLDTDQWDIDLGGLRGGMENSAMPVTRSDTAKASLNQQVKALYPGFSSQQTAEFIAGLRASGTSIEIQLARLSMDFQALDRSLERWVNGPMGWRPVTETHSIPVSSLSRRNAAEIIKRCWQRQTPVTGAAARHLNGFVLDLSGLVIGDLPYLPGDFSHVTAINISRTYMSQQSVSALVSKCPGLYWLNAENNFLSVIPAGIRHLRHLTRLTLANNRIVVTADMMQTLRRLPDLRLLNLERNPVGPLLDVSEMPQLLNLFLRGTGLLEAPAGVFETPNLIALDLRSNRITTLPDAFFEMPGTVRHTLLDGNPLSLGTRVRIGAIGGPLVFTEQADNVEFWLAQTPALERVHRRAVWDLFWSEMHAADFFEIISRLQGSADFSLSRAAVTQRVWDLLEAGARDELLRSRLIAMAAFPETCVDGAAVIFSNMELEVLVSQARSLATAGREGPQLLKLLGGLFRLEEVDSLARLDAAARVGFTEDVEVQLAYRVGLASRLELPINSRTMQFSSSADVTDAALNRAERTVLSRETPEELTAFAVKRDFWIDHLKRQYADEFVACQRATALRMEALDDLQSERPMSDAAYKGEADAIMKQRQRDEEELMTQLTQAELVGGGLAANEV
ncbi:NEL-type E3 ubiquitin ligase domain-containing protein [Pseudomonas sp. Irchel 3A5]|uniref:NEL-type E3 ubiquitin ligase domain-containing protein n=1 Tax=Pseudomonas sp. Irchel 3A5 TaxID=2008911 RepID=UPI000BA3516B|nr:NEL-type E3 ubiquitin ligase domain-containing protein [Pseudomonas sp. Irchel 3A5]